MNAKTLIRYGNPIMEMATTHIAVIARIAGIKSNVQKLPIIVQEVHQAIVQEVLIALVDLLILAVQEVRLIIAQEVHQIIVQEVHQIIVLIIQIVHVVVAIVAQEEPPIKIQENLPFMTFLGHPAKIQEVSHLKLDFLVIYIEENKYHFINFFEIPLALAKKGKKSQAWSFIYDGLFDYLWIIVFVLWIIGFFVDYLFFGGLLFFDGLLFFFCDFERECFSFIQFTIVHQGPI